MNAVSDTLLLVKHVQSVCLVVQAGKTPAKAVARAVEKLAEAGSRPVGFVMNRLPKGSGTGYYYYYSAGNTEGGLWRAWRRTNVSVVALVNLPPASAPRSYLDSLLASQ